MTDHNNAYQLSKNRIMCYEEPISHERAKAYDSLGLSWFRIAHD